MPKTKYPIFKCLHRGEKGFTLIELLIVVAILGIIAAVVIPRVSGFMRSGNLSAANTEAAAVKVACVAYYSEHDVVPADSGDLVSGGYLDRTPKSTYEFSEPGQIDPAPTDGWAADPYLFTFDVDTQLWSSNST